MAEYHLSLVEAVWEFPLSVALVFLPIRNERQGAESSAPNYAQEAAVQARSKARSFLKENFTLVNDPTLPWQLGN